MQFLQFFTSLLSSFSFFFFFFLHLSAYLQENNLQAAVLMSCSSVTKWKIYLIFPIIGTHCVILYRIHPLKKSVTVKKTRMF